MGTEFYLSAPLFPVKNKNNKGHWTQNIRPSTEEALGFISGPVTGEPWFPFLGRGSCEELPCLPPFLFTQWHCHLCSVYLVLCSHCHLLIPPLLPCRLDPCSSLPAPSLLGPARPSPTPIGSHCFPSNSPKPHSGPGHCSAHVYLVAPFAPTEVQSQAREASVSLPFKLCFTSLLLFLPIF